MATEAYAGYKYAMKITSATLIISEYSADHISLLTDLPEGVWSFTGHQTLEMRCARGTGAAYLAAHFPDAPVTVVGLDGH